MCVLKLSEQEGKEAQTAQVDPWLQHFLVSLQGSDLLSGPHYLHHITGSRNMRDVLSPGALIVFETKSHQTLAGLKLLCPPILLSPLPTCQDCRYVPSHVVFCAAKD